GVRHIENLPTNLQLVVFAPWHRKRLCQTHVEINIAGIAKHVAISALTGTATAEALVSLRWIGRQIRRVGGAATCGTRTDRSNARSVIAAVPVSGPATKIQGRLNRQS